MATSFDFRGKKALVTGGSRGIGRGTVEALAKANIDKIYAIARSQADLDAVKSEFSCVETISVDMCNWEETKTALEKIEPVNYLVNNAGYAEVQEFLDTTPELLDNLLNLNLKGLINVSQIVCKKMMEIGGGVVVNVSSVSSLKPSKGLTAYMSTKGGVDALTRQMAFELAPKIRVNVVNPTLVLTDLSKSVLDPIKMEQFINLHPLRRAAMMEEVTSTILYLLSNSAGMITGHSLPICGGFTTL